MSKIILTIVSLIIGLLIIYPSAVDQKREELEDAGLNTSVFELLDPDTNQNSQSDSTNNEL
jgi:hypothetical protein